jgi:hypothetical protein
MSTANTIRAVHLRRALLLFAIVLGMAALVASLSRPIEERRGQTTASEPREPGPPEAAPAPAPELPPTVTFDAVKDESRRVAAGSAATVEVSVDEPGDVAIPGMGLIEPAEPLTPARFDILANSPGRYELTFTPADGDPSEPAGSLVVTSAG